LGPVALFLALAWNATRAGFEQPKVSFAWPGDGWGSIGWIYDMHAAFDRDGGVDVLGDTYLSDTIGGRLETERRPTATLWKAVYWLVPYAFQAPDDVYDFVLFATFALNGMAAYWLVSSVLGAPWFLGVLAGLGAACHRNFTSRAVGHLLLTQHFMLLFLIGFLIRAVRRPSLGRVLALAGILVLCFSVNEYYGYFSTVVCGIAFPLGVSLFRREHQIGAKHLLATIAVAGVALATAMALVYPTMVGGKILALFAPSSGAGGFQFAHDLVAFREFSLRSIGSTLAPWSGLWGDGLARAEPFITRESGEFTFHAGLLAPLGCALFLVASLVPAFRRRVAAAHPEATRLAVVLAATALVGYCLAIKPSNSISLVPFTYRFMPMFRCGVRAILFFDLATLTAFLLALAVAFRAIEREGATVTRFVAGAVLAAIGVAAVLDETRGRLLSPELSTFEIKLSKIYDELAPRPDGWALELPYHWPGVDTPETDYNYFLGRTVHGKAILNGGNFSYGADIMRRIVDRLQPNAPSPRLVAVLKEVGIRYVIAHRDDKRYSFDALATLTGLSKLASTPDADLYEVDDAAPQYDPQALARAIDLPWNAAQR
jgi:hypothetical protein